MQVLVNNGSSYATHTLVRRPEFNKAITSRRRARGGRERAADQQGGWIAGKGRKSKWARTGRSEATHRRTGAAITWGGAVKVGMCRSREARRLKNVANDSLRIVSEMNVIMWALGGRSLASHIQDKRAANR